ncbi:MAG: hypothetical protein ACI9EF_002088 [Pseudohongiellaceae bacterium]|jgi:hypothetical protein
MPTRHACLATVALLLVVLAGCGDGDSEALPVARAMPSSMASCAECHGAIVKRFMGHGMSDTLGPLEQPIVGGLQQNKGRDVYRFESEGEQTFLVHELPDGGRRRQLVVGRYGAGVMDTAYVGTELDGDGQATGRLSFLPVESMVGHGLVPAPFEAMQPGTGFDMPFTAECLECHTTQVIAKLPRAAADITANPETARIWPDSQLGADAFEHLESFACDACHGPAQHHAELMTASLESGEPSDQLGLERIGELPAQRQRHICARCHLQGEGQLHLGEIAAGGPQPPDFLARRPVLVAANPGDDYRFVGQLHRLSLSACFAGTDTMTCVTCHDPHRAVLAQGTASFDARCQSCHESADSCSRPPRLAVQDVTGHDARSTAGCVDCHVRRSQPFDLPGARTADHFVRRKIPLPETLPMRAWEDGSGELEIFADEQLSTELRSETGQLWERGVLALGLFHLGRVDDSISALAQLGTAAASETLPALDRLPDVRFLRGLIYEFGGDHPRAKREYSAALALDASHPGARLNRGWLRLDSGDAQGADDDAAELLRRYPQSEKPWNLRAAIAGSYGDLPAAVAAFARSAEAWPADADIWHDMGRLMMSLGARDNAILMLERAAELRPSSPGLAEDLAAARR